MISVGINGFGRIGKSIFIQLIQLINECKCIKAINAPNFDIKHIETYLKYDSVHKYDTNFTIEIIDNENFKINNNIIHVFKNRDAKQLDWKVYGITYVIDATGSYLTTDKCNDHNVDYVIMCAPPKDNTPLFVYNVNHEKYNGEKIVSNASCTTNCITPVLKFLDEKYGIINGNFTTIHSTTASQTTVDILNSNNRTHRSILNNIIPHSTGASGAISELIPTLTDKIFGTSLRVPVSNVSIVDLNVELERDISFSDLMEDFENDDFIQVNNKNLVSCDFMTTTMPSIIDKKASMQLGMGKGNDNGKCNRFKLMIWYDNEWSYSAQVIRLLEVMIKKNYKPFIDNYNFKGKKVILRVDWNIPTDKDHNIMSDFRIVSSLPTIKRIMNDNPERIIIISHFGRPNGYTDKYSWKHYLEKIQSYFTDEIHFLPDGLSEKTLDMLNDHSSLVNSSLVNSSLVKLYLLENIRFHDAETEYENNSDTYIIEKYIINQLGNFYVNDAFGCMHRNHLSICGINVENKAYGYIVDKEIRSLEILLNNNSGKTLAIIGGAKMDDKLRLIHSLSKKMNDIFIGGGNINSILKNDMKKYLQEISSNKASIHLMSDGVCAQNATDKLSYYSESENLLKDEYFFDIGYKSLDLLEQLIIKNDIIFWNGNMGITENSMYEGGSNALVNMLMKHSGEKKIIIAGGNTVEYISKFDHKFYYVSTGGGSTIDYISNGSLVGVDDLFREKIPKTY